MHNLPRVILSANTRCCRCGGNLFEGQQVTVIWDEQIDGYKHKHSRRGLCHHRNRAVEIMEVIEVINAQRHPAPEA